MLRLVGALGTVVVLVAAGTVGPVGAAEPTPVNAQAADTPPAAPVGNPEGAYRASVFVTLPMSNGFADATDALVESQRLVQEALLAAEMVPLVRDSHESDAVLTILGRGTGYDELTAALKTHDRSVIASPVLVHGNERYIEAMLTVGECGDAATNATRQSKSASCYRKILVGLGFTDRDERRGVKDPAPNSWKACANALARDVQAWVTQNASRLLARRG